MQSRDYLFILISVAAFLLILSLRIFLGIL